MPTIAPPNAEMLAAFYLKDVEAVTGLGIDPDDIGSELRKERPSKDHPAMRITQHGGGPQNGKAFWLHRPRLQCDVWAAAKNTAYDIAAAAMAAMVDAPNHHHDLAVVTRVAVLLGLQDIPDPTFKPAMHRWTFDTVWTLHPHRDTGT